MRKLTQILIGLSLIFAAVLPACKSGNAEAEAAAQQIEEEVQTLDSLNNELEQTVQEIDDKEKALEEALEALDEGQ